MEAERTGVKFDPAGECLGPPQVGNDVRALEKNDRKDSPEQGTDADVFCEIPECWNCSVFGTQLPGILFCSIFFSTVDFSASNYIWKILCPNTRGHASIL